MKKKGISPLIATVLIIGFTVALAAIIITWSTSFTKKMQEQTEETANLQIICATDVVYGIKSVCATGTEYRILIQNDGKEPIKNWILRFYKSESLVQSKDTREITVPEGADIPEFGIKRLTIAMDSTPEDYRELVKKIEAIPIIVRAGQPIVCSQNVDSYGNTDGDPMTIALNPC